MRDDETVEEVLYRYAYYGARNVLIASVLLLGGAFLVAWLFGGLK